MQNTTPCSFNPATPPPRVLTLDYLLSIPSESQFAPGPTSENARGMQAPLPPGPGNAHRKALLRQEELGDIIRSALAIIDDYPDNEATNKPGERRVPPLELSSPR
jgi:hypothetical protein